jgi:hypothetical protein
MSARAADVMSVPVLGRRDAAGWLTAGAPFTVRVTVAVSVPPLLLRTVHVNKSAPPAQP